MSSDFRAVDTYGEKIDIILNPCILFSTLSDYRHALCQNGVSMNLKKKHTQILTLLNFIQCNLVWTLQKIVSTNIKGIIAPMQYYFVFVLLSVLYLSYKEIA